MKGGLTVQPYVRFAMHDTINREWYVSRAIWDYEIIYIADGSMIVETEQHRYVANTGDIIFLRPGTHHVLRSGSDLTVQPHVHFDFFKDELSERILVSLKQKSAMTAEEKTFFRHDDLAGLGADFPVVMTLHESGTIRDLLYKIIDEYRLKMPSYEAYMSTLMTQIIITIQRSYKTATSEFSRKYAATFEIIKRYILDNIDRNITIDELAELAFLSKYYFSRCFAEYFSESPHKYMTRLRIGRAKELLAYNNALTVADIAEKMNFDSPQTFSSWFKKSTGQSPLHYRQSVSKGTVAPTVQNTI